MKAPSCTANCAPPSRPVRPGTPAPRPAPPPDAGPARSASTSRARPTRRPHNDGTVGYPYTVYPNIVLPFAGTPFTVTPGASRTCTWDAARTNGRYDFTVHGPDGFVRRFAGTVIRDGQEGHNDVGVPIVTADPSNSARLTLQLANDGMTDICFTAAPNDFDGSAQTVWVKPGKQSRLVRPPDRQGHYDVTVTAGTGTRFTQRYAGRVH
ncbi:DUF756 domain-containing protein [Kitasatospora sp. NBC_00240]|uniref:phospholipase domain-containing protein n=1 Tax=Kitasatospora sp. NBC_00240 TaxID=2903567 RepID=UPI0022576130|nr:phospholipase domain-containing protein [Kitasatospora sp. NBC_00240]MCX5214493.1 DUF756 domain-containing protein [Kitasatospora sp. NBC_00240]